MRQKKSYGAIDNFRLAAALLIVAIHTAPLASFSPTVDFLVTYCFGRVAVPFFFLVTGFFVLAPYQRAAGRLAALGGNRQSAEYTSAARKNRQIAWRSSGSQENASQKVWKFLKKIVDKA